MCAQKDKERDTFLVFADLLRQGRQQQLNLPLIEKCRDNSSTLLSSTSQLEEEKGCQKRKN